MAGTHVVIPYAPRPLQKEIHQALERFRWGVAVCHRRFGKTVCAVNHLQRAAVTCKKPRPRFGYIAPTYAQGKAIAWDYMKHYAAPIPGVRMHESELRIDYPMNESQVRIYGADNPDSLRGLYFDGVVLDEYGLMRPHLFREVVRPALADRQGWALFLGTPNGKNQFYDIIHGNQDFVGAKHDPNWFFAEYKASETHIIPETELAMARSQMTPDQYEQEFECSFEASVQGAIYAREVRAAREDGRITTVPYDPMLQVDTDWDLGMDDSTAIWFSQESPGGEIRFIDYYEASGEGLPHYREVLNQKRYAYGYHYAPHDIQVRELSTGKSRLDLAGDLGIFFEVTPRLLSKEGMEVHDGINAARMMFKRCWFDQTQCKRGIEALQHYRWAYNTSINEFKATPVHDWASHGADAFRGRAVRNYVPIERWRSKTTRDYVPPEKPDPYDELMKANPKRRQDRFRRGGY